MNTTSISEILNVMTAEQWLHLAAKIAQIQRGTGYGRVIVEIAKRRPRFVGVEETSLMPVPAQPTE